MKNFIDEWMMDYNTKQLFIKKIDNDDYKFIYKAIIKKDKKYGKLDIGLEVLRISARLDNFKMFKFVSNFCEREKVVEYFKNWSHMLINVKFDMLKYIIEKYGIEWLIESPYYKKTIQDENYKLIIYDIKGKGFANYCYLVSKTGVDVFYGDHEEI